MDTEEYKKKVEREILEIIEKHLKDGSMDAKRAQEVARFVLDSLSPPLNLDQIYQIVQNFDDHFSELMPVVIETTNDYDNKVKELVSAHASKLIQQGKVSEATAIIQKALNREIKVSN